VYKPVARPLTPVEFHRLAGSFTASEEAADRRDFGTGGFIFLALYNISSGLLRDLQDSLQGQGVEIFFPVDGELKTETMPNALLAGRNDFFQRLGERLASREDRDWTPLSRVLAGITGPAVEKRWLLGGGKSLVMGGRPRIMGILNLTPDSFYDGSAYRDVNSAIDHAARMVEEGADLIDVGGESTRPGASPVSADLEKERVVPVIREIARRFPEQIISVDTYKSEVARAALGEGAAAVNDISAGTLDKRMLETVAGLKAGYVMMHMRGEPRTMQLNTAYDDMVGEIYLFFARCLEKTQESGISWESIALDPGIGFGKSPEANYELIYRLAEFAPLGRPILAGCSRKSFMALAGLKDPAERLEGTLAACTVAVISGADILRVHDIGPVQRAVSVASLFPKPSRFQ